jgi:hypothetical protein
MVSVAHGLATAQTHLPCRWQNVPYVKCMVNGLVALNGACDQAVHNKERCLSLSAYATPSRRRASAVRFHPLPNAIKCSWLEGLRAVLDRVIDVHEQKGAQCIWPCLPCT